MNVKRQPTLLLRVKEDQPMIETCRAFLRETFDITSESPDLHVINQERQSIKISQVRELKQLLTFHPYQATKTVVCLLWADLATQAAQHAMLKSLEEPPPYAQCVLATTYPEKLLPTVQSRCREVIFNFTSTEEASKTPTDLPEISQVLNLSYSQAIDLATQFKDRADAQMLVKNLLSQLHQHPEYPTQELVFAAYSLLETQELLEKNMHVQLALESCFFEIRGINKNKKS